MAWVSSLRDQTASAARLLTGLNGFLGSEETAADCRSTLRASLAARGPRFLEFMRRGVYEHASSPYLPLLEQAGVAFADLERLVADQGVEGALGRLFDAGVRVKLDAFKRQPRTFDNPLAAKHYETRSSGSRGPGARLGIDLDLLAHESRYERLSLDQLGLANRPKVLWRVGPPGGVGLKFALYMARLGTGVDTWFSQTPVSLRADPRHAALMHAVRTVAWWHGRRVPWPQYVSVADPLPVAACLARAREAGTPAYLNTPVSCAVRVCTTARARGLDIRGTFIIAGGEPLTASRARVIEAAGCDVRTQYGMSEVSRIGIPCGSPLVADDVHLMTDKVAVVQRESAAAPVPALWLTTLHWRAPKVMVNVELGDYGVLERRPCGCVWDTLGFTDHLHTIGSYEKLTTEGMHFIGTDLIALVDDVLPARFGGASTDYQFVESDANGITRVDLVVSPDLGPLDEGAVRRTVLDRLGSGDASRRMMAHVWCEGDTLRVIRRHPHATPTGKIQTLHVAKTGGGHP
jgi:hypothetical protein